LEGNAREAPAEAFYVSGRIETELEGLALARRVNEKSHRGSSHPLAFFVLPL